MCNWLQINKQVRLSVENMKTPKKKNLKVRINEIADKIGHMSSYEQRVDTVLPKGCESSLKWQLLDDTLNQPNKEHVTYIQNASLAINGHLYDGATIDDVENWLNTYVTDNNFQSDDKWSSIFDGFVQTYISQEIGMTLFIYKNNQWHKQNIVIDQIPNLS